MGVFLTKNSTNKPHFKQNTPYEEIFILQAISVQQVV
jgi:hypothetical protein